MLLGACVTYRIVRVANSARMMAVLRRRVEGIVGGVIDRTVLAQWDAGDGAVIIIACRPR